MKNSSSIGVFVADNGNTKEIDCEPSPGKVAVQKGDDRDGDGASGPIIKLRVSHGPSHHEINVPAQATFGDLKRLLAHVTGLETNEQKLLFRGKVREDEEFLHLLGVKNMSKVLLLGDPERKKLEVIKMDERMLEACEAVVKVRSEVDKLAEKVCLLESNVNSGYNVPDREFIVLAEFLMVQLLKLDGINAEGKAKAQRRLEVRRVQSLVETVDNLKARNSNHISNSDNAVSPTTKL